METGIVKNEASLCGFTSCAPVERTALQFTNSRKRFVYQIDSSYDIDI